eukprot:TRINITY_DN8973_c0_g1_i1.p1 TRINITY_DN8973_c0_g1~~TRINITY_DN8973_c0_g1_i1.p1  ORF type:complete len:300 (+),score=60.73 TRINITY_DN8973_c0_g1_i1:75-974(+)
MARSLLPVALCGCYVSFCDAFGQSPCHHIDEAAAVCIEADSSVCEAGSDGLQDGSCASTGYKYCAMVAPGTELWASGDDFYSCEKALTALQKAGYKNDGCGGKSDPLPCQATLQASSECHRVNSDGLSCTEGEGSSCEASYAHFKDGSCANADYKYCFKGAFGTELWASGDKGSCEDGMKVLQKTGYKNDGCGGKSAPLPCQAPLQASSECHRVNSDGLSCTEGEGSSCEASYAHFKDGSCASADYKYCFKGAFGTELWASGDKDSCEGAMKVLHNTGYKNDGCGGKSQPLPCGELVVV